MGAADLSSRSSATRAPAGERGLLHGRVRARRSLRSAASPTRCDGVLDGRCPLSVNEEPLEGVGGDARPAEVAARHHLADAPSQSAIDAQPLRASIAASTTSCVTPPSSAGALVQEATKSRARIFFIKATTSECPRFPRGELVEGDGGRTTKYASQRLSRATMQNAHRYPAEGIDVARNEHSPSSRKRHNHPNGAWSKRHSPKYLLTSQNTHCTPDGSLHFPDKGHIGTSLLQATSARPSPAATQRPRESTGSTSLLRVRASSSTGGSAPQAERAANVAVRAANVAVQPLRACAEPHAKHMKPCSVTIASDTSASTPQRAQRA